MGGVTRDRLTDLARGNAGAHTLGLASICSAHPAVIEAAFRHALAGRDAVLIEATCNQVNQDGGYTGMTPADFAAFVRGIADRVGFPGGRIILGGDHLGPNPWRRMPAGPAMARAEAMVAAYVAAGFGKIHLDASMGCAGEPESVGDALTARRAARLAAAAEAASSKAGLPPPVYVIGTEVPTPGGALEALDHVLPTTPEAALETYGIHADVFCAAGLEEALSRVVALVVQPGVEFGDADVVHYDPAGAASLSAALRSLPGLVFEAHSTDYQRPDALAALVRDGYRILKVGPWLTFAFREAIYGLDAIARDLKLSETAPSLQAVMERLMQDEPQSWASHYDGDARELAMKRHFSYSDRIRYYWPKEAARGAVADLLRRLGDVAIPLPLVSQHLGRLAPRFSAPGAGKPTAQVLIAAAIDEVLAVYAQATRTG